MTEAMPFLQKAILLSYAPRPLNQEGVFLQKLKYDILLLSIML